MQKNAWLLFEYTQYNSMDLFSGELFTWWSGTGGTLGGIEFKLVDGYANFNLTTLALFDYNSTT